MPVDLAPKGGSQTIVEQYVLSKEEYSRVLEMLDILETIESSDYRYIESSVAKAISPLLLAEGFEVHFSQKDPKKTGYGLVAYRGDEGGLIVESKHYTKNRKISSNNVKELVGSATLGNHGRAILVSNSEFSFDAQNMVRQKLPTRVELMTYANLREWASRLREGNTDVEVEVRILMQSISRRCAELIARNEDTLNQLEWRDMERVIAEVFNGLGFDSELTPGSKDGGKDIVLSWIVDGQKAKYFVEIKHWRSSTKVGSKSVRDLLDVVVSENIEGGLFLSTYGYTSNAFEQLTTIDRQKLSFGDKDKIVSLCKTYVKAKAGFWNPPENLLDIVQ